MMLLTGIVIWFALIYLVLKFFAVSSEIGNTTYKKYKAKCPCGHVNEVYHLEWESIKCSACGMYYEKSEFDIS